MKGLIFMLKSKKGYTLIELLVVIGILAVLAAIAIPAVAGLIDRANIAHDNTNANEMTNSIERFTSEYELYKNDVSSIGVSADKLDAMQGRVYNVVGTTERDGLKEIENTYLDKDTFYPLTRVDARRIISAYMKTTSSMFDPKQSDKCYWYCPAAGIVVAGDSNATPAQLNELVISGKDVKGNDLTPSTHWIDLTCGDDIIVDDDTPVVPDENLLVVDSLGWDIMMNAELNGTAYGVGIYSSLDYPDGFPGDGQPNFTCVNSHGVEVQYYIALGTDSVEIFDLSDEEKVMLDNETFVWVDPDPNQHYGEPIFQPYNATNGEYKKAVYGKQHDVKDMYEVTWAQNVYELTSLDVYGNGFMGTFSNGMKAYFKPYDEPMLLIDGQWYEMPDYRRYHFDLGTDQYGDSYGIGMYDVVPLMPTEAPNENGSYIPPVASDGVEYCIGLMSLTPIADGYNGVDVFFGVITDDDGSLSNIQSAYCSIMASNYCDISEVPEGMGYYSLGVSFPGHTETVLLSDMDAPSSWYDETEITYSADGKTAYIAAGEGKYILEITNFDAPTPQFAFTMDGVEIPMTTYTYYF